MTTPIAIDAADVSSAANFLEQYLSDQIEDGDFTKGTALRDLTVNAIAAVYAFMRADAAQIRQMQSLATVKAATGGDTEALTDAVTGILSNLLITPKSGGKARGIITGHASRLADVFVTTTTRFTYSQGLVFVLDGNDTLFIPQALLVPIIDATGAVLDYTFTVPVVAVATGETYNVEAGLFSTFDRFNPYVTRIENLATFSGGKGPETVDEILARAPTALSVRNLVNSRSIPATLNDNFDDIQSVLVIGMGDPEMQRDIVPTISPGLRFHVGGAVDIYLRTPLVETSFTGIVGDLYARPDGVAVVFSDVDGVSFAAVEPGDIVRVITSLPVVPAEFLVVEVIGTNALVVSEGAPFSVATDEASPPAQVSYTIGRVGPSYSDVVSGVGGVPYASGQTSRRSATTGRITLPGGPVMDILDVAVVNPPPIESSFKSTVDGFEHFPTQVNQTPSEAVTPSQGLQYRVVVHSPPYAQSAAQWMEIQVGTDGNPTRFDGLQLRVRYRTIEAFASIDAFVRGARERISACHQLPRGHHPVVVGMSLTYTLAATATATLDNVAIAQTIVDYVNTFDAAASSIDVSSVITLVKNAYPAIANVVPSQPGQPILSIFYNLRAPTGDVLSYATTDVVSVDAAKQTAGPVLSLAVYGVTARTLRYVANVIDVVARQAGT